MQNPIVRYLLILTMVIAMVLILWFPAHTLPSVVGYILLTLGMLVVWLTTKKKKTE